jgi:uncharacterized protein (UPF0276 family)
VSAANSARRWKTLAAKHPLVCHGLSLSLGGFAPLDETFLGRVRRFLERHDVALYSEHLSYCADDGQLYDLLPIPFTEEAVHFVAARIRQAQDILGRRIAVENVSYYAAPHQAMREIDFINAVLAEADCDLLLDVNNIHVNAINHRYDAHEFLSRLPGERIAYIHVAGHYDEAEDLKVDTHGAPVKDAVWQLLGAAYAQFGLRPTLLERDFNIPPYAELVAELDTIRSVMRASRPRRTSPFRPGTPCPRLRPGWRRPRACANSNWNSRATCAIRSMYPRRKGSRTAASASTASCCSTTSKTCLAATSR